MSRVTLADYRSLAALRYELRRFLAFSEQAARDAGVEPQQHQLLLAVRGLPDGKLPTIKTLAERLFVKHHTAVALIDKLEERGLVTRQRDHDDRRAVRVVLTREGEALLRQLSAIHREQLRKVGPDMVAALGAILDANQHANRHADQRSAKRARARIRER